MNFEYNPILKPLKVYFVNPLVPASQLTIVKIMSGLVFGNDQLIDLTLVVSVNEFNPAEAFKLELESCAFACTDSIKISSDLPCVSDGDVFCFITNLKNPNSFKFNKELLEDDFEALYFTIKLANSLRWTDNKGLTVSEPVKRSHFDEKGANIETISKNETKPIIITDGLVATDIIKTLSTNLPSNIFFYPAPITSIAKSILADYLDVPCKDINEIIVWAANDAVFHVDVKRPLIIEDTVEMKSQCDWNMIGGDLLKSFHLDSTQFNASWMKKEFIEKRRPFNKCVHSNSGCIVDIALLFFNVLTKIDIIINCNEKVASSALKNPYGCIHKAVEFTKTLRDIWRTRTFDDDTKVFRNIGCISDGSVGTIKGYPYILPVVFERGFWTVNNIFEDNTHVKQEIKRINKTVKEYHEELIPFCKKFLQENIINHSNTEDKSGTTQL